MRCLLFVGSWLLKLLNRSNVKQTIWANKTNSKLYFEKLFVKTKEKSIKKIWKFIKDHAIFSNNISGYRCFSILNRIHQSIQLSFYFNFFWCAISFWAFVWCEWLQHSLKFFVWVIECKTCMKAIQSNRKPAKLMHICCFRWLTFCVISLSRALGLAVCPALCVCVFDYLLPHFSFKQYFRYLIYT